MMIEILVKEEVELKSLMKKLKLGLKLGLVLKLMWVAWEWKSGQMWE